MCLRGLFDGRHVWTGAGRKARGHLCFYYIKYVSNVNCTMGVSRKQSMVELFHNKLRHNFITKMYNINTKVPRTVTNNNLKHHLYK